MPVEAPPAQYPRWKLDVGRQVRALQSDWHNEDRTKRFGGAA